MSPKPMIIEAAVNGGITTKSQNPHVPYTPEEIAADAVAAVRAGASVIHLHVREPDGGRVPSAEGLLTYYRKVFRLIRTECQPLIYPTFPIGDPDRPLEPSRGPEPRFRHFRQLAEEPLTRCDLGAFDAGSLNIPGYDAKTRTVRKPDHVYTNTFATVRYFVEGFRDLGIPPTLNIFEAGFLRTALILSDLGLIPEPLIPRFYFSDQFGLPPCKPSIDAYVAMLGGRRCEWFGAVIDGDIRPYLSLFAKEGGHIRVGLEDFSYEGSGMPSNADLVTLAVEAARETGRPVAMPEQSRQMLGT